MSYTGHLYKITSMIKALPITVVKQKKRNKKFFNIYFRTLIGVKFSTKVKTFVQSRGINSHT